MKKKKKLAFAEGGAVQAPPLAPEAGPAPAPAPQEQGVQGEVMGLLEQYAQTKDAELAIQIAELMLLDLGIQSGQDPSIQEQPVTPPPLPGVGGSQGSVPVF